VFVWPKESRVFLSVFLQGSGTKATGPHILFCLKKPNKTAFDVCFCVLMLISSSITGFFVHQNKGGHALGVEILSLCTGDSSFDHVPSSLCPLQD
jgi:hypothetical protein